MNGLSSRPQKHSNTAKTRRAAGRAATVAIQYRVDRNCSICTRRGAGLVQKFQKQMEREEPNPAAIGEADDGVQANQPGKNKAFLYHAAGSAVILLVAVILRTQQAGKCWDPLSRRVRHPPYFVRCVTQQL